MMIVVVGLCVEDGLVLTQQRLNEGRFANLWEFPGGKVEDGETMRVALAREWKEELGLDVHVGRLITECVILFPKSGNTLLPLFEVTIAGYRRPGDNDRGLDGQLVRWASLEEVRKLPGVPTMERYLPFVESIIGAAPEWPCKVCRQEVKGDKTLSLVGKDFVHSRCRRLLEIEKQGQ